MEQRAEETKKVVDAFNEAFNRHDIDGIMTLMTDDCIFESTGPAPDGGRHQGQRDVRRCWEELFSPSPEARFSIEEMIVAGDRCVVRWRYDWDGGHIRGVDVFKVREGKIAQKLAYVKG